MDEEIKQLLTDIRDELRLLRTQNKKDDKAYDEPSSPEYAGIIPGRLRRAETFLTKARAHHTANLEWEGLSDEEQAARYTALSERHKAQHDAFMAWLEARPKCQTAEPEPTPA